MKSQTILQRLANTLYQELLKNKEKYSNCFELNYKTTLFTVRKSILMFDREINNYLVNLFFYLPQISTPFCSDMCRALIRGRDLLKSLIIKCHA